MRTYFIETWGCQMNRHDSEHLEGQLRARRMTAAADADGADLVLLNTCSVREKPVQKIVSRIGELAVRRPAPLIGVCGCVAQQEGKRLLERASAVRFVLGPGQNRRLAEALRLVEQGERPVLVGFAEDGGTDFDTVFRSSTTRGMVTVVEGCNEFCTFCIVPHTRGREISRPMADVVAEVRTLAASGLREVELLGQTVNAYRCPRTSASFAALLDAVAAIGGLDRVRYVTSHPRHFDPPLIEVLARRPNVSRYLHLPFQAGADRILKKMNRKYTRAEYVDLVGRIRSAVPGINLSTDVIVGFPGETEAEFEQSLEVLEAVRFGQVFAFAFSPRPGTPAARYAEPVPEGVARERLQRLFATTDRIALELNRRLVGSTVQVLVDGDSRRRTADWQGRGEDNRVYNFPKIPGVEIGDIVAVEVVDAGSHSLRGVAAAARGVRLPVLSA